MTGSCQQSAHTETAVDFEAYFAVGGTAGFVRHVLSSPLKPGGTLAALASVAKGGLHLAKTGTNTGDGASRDKWVIGVRGTAACPRSYALLVGAADPGQPAWPEDKRQGVRGRRQGALAMSEMHGLWRLH